MNDARTADVLIAGQGAAAYAAALYSARYQQDTLMVAEQFGGETATGGQIENYPGVPDIDGYDLMLKFKEQTDGLDVPLVMSNLLHVKPENGHFMCEMDDGSTVRALSVILAVGRERRKLWLDHEDDWVGKGISYCSTCDAPLYRNRTVAVVGGGSAAVEGAVLIARYATRVYLIYRREHFNRPEPVLLRILGQTDNISQLMSTEVVELLGTDLAGLQGIRISRPFEGTDELEVDGLFIEIGADPRVAIARELGLERNPETGEVHVNRLMHTSMPGIYAAGDLTDASGPLKQTVTASAQGAIAALSAYTYVSEHPSKLVGAEA
jgi:thioredoxin reductase (NADPH)